MESKAPAHTPMQKLAYVSDRFGVDCWCKRDDLLPMSGGGNKVRKIHYILAEATAQDCDALVTTGGTQSNHARVVALSAAQRGWPCELVLHGKQEELDNPNGNLLLMLLAGARISIVHPVEIAESMHSAMAQLRSEGYHPYEIRGGGHSVTGALAYADAIIELHAQCDPKSWMPDWIVHASGTGTTQAGIVAGVKREGWSTHVVGVSVARRNPRGVAIVTEAYRDLCAHLDITFQEQNIDFRDNWVGAGYGIPDDAVVRKIILIARKEGLILDPTYTGKAFTALLELLQRGEIQSGSRVLFWHTGGLLNLLVSTCFENTRLAL